MSWPRPPRAPWWFTLLLVVLAIAAAFMFPAASTVLDNALWLGADYVGWLYPAYVILTAILAWTTYPARRTLAWVLVALLFLTATGLFIATLAQPQP